MNPLPIKDLVFYEDSEKLDVRVGTIISLQKVTKSNKLMKLTVAFGDHTRSILAGIKQERADPKEIENRQGMLFDIGYADNITPCLAIPEVPVPIGTRAGEIAFNRLLHRIHQKHATK